MLTPGYLWRDRDGSAFLVAAELDILARSLRPMASAGQDVVVMDPGAGEAEGDALARLERLQMVARGCLTERGRPVAAAWLDARRVKIESNLER